MFKSVLLSFIMVSSAYAYDLGAWGYAGKDGDLQYQAGIKVSFKFDTGLWPSKQEWSYEITQAKHALFGYDVFDDSYMTARLDGTIGPEFPADLTTIIDDINERNANAGVRRGLISNPIASVTNSVVKIGTIMKERPILFSSVVAGAIVAWYALEESGGSSGGKPKSDADKVVNVTGDNNNVDLNPLGESAEVNINGDNNSFDTKPDEGSSTFIVNDPVFNNSGSGDSIDADTTEGSAE